MLPQIILLAFLSISNRECQTDSLILPIKNGKIIRDNTDSSLSFHPIGILIFPTDQFNVQSCSEGIIRSITKLNNTYIVLVLSKKNLYYSYSNINTVGVKKGQNIKRGTVLGVLSKEIGIDRHIVFSTFKGDKYVNSED